MKRKILYTLREGFHWLMIGGMFFLTGCENNRQTGFAVVVDEKTYAETKAEVEAYCQAIEEVDGLKTYLVTEHTDSPDSIRTTLMRLYQQKDAPIEGAVFIGDIPVAMVRDGQHLTSAFKMDQEHFEWQESSVPSDRFYDDFSLRFTFLKQDSLQPLYHYYSLDADCAQLLQPNLYTGRIKTCDDETGTRYQKIARYLQKAVAQKRETNKLDQAFFFSGHGYVSESLGARMDEKVALLENFPWMKTQQNSVEYIDHSRDVAIKTRVKNEMQREDLDLAILHHHGDAEIEYMNGVPKVAESYEHMRCMQQFLREMLRYYKEQGKDVNAEKKRLSAKYDNVPDKWFEGAFDSAVIVKDSLFDRSLDLYYDEYGAYQPNVRMVIMDACYNGSFHKDKYIGGGYIFNPGKTMVAIGNSVNVLQDKWSDRYVGLMGAGIRVGRIVQMNPFLEQHLIGDPTFHFTPSEDVPFDINKAYANESLGFWMKQLESRSMALRILAMRRMADFGYEKASERLLEIFRTSDCYVERMEAMVLLSVYNDSNFIECLKLALNDSYEMTQRFAVNFVGKVGDPALIPDFIRVISRNNTTERIEFDAKQVLSVLPEQPMLDAFEAYYDTIHYYMERDTVHNQIRHAIEVCARKWQEDVHKLYSDTIRTRAKMMYSRYLRNNNMHEEVPALVQFVDTCAHDSLRVMVLESLGWFNKSCRRAEIAEEAKKISEDEKNSDIVRKEALKTYNRLAGVPRKE